MSALLGYEPVPGEESAERIWLEAPGTYRVAAGCKDELLAAMHSLRPREGAPCSCSAPTSRAWPSPSASRCSATSASCPRTAA